MDAKESTERRIDAGQLHRYDAKKLLAAASAAIAFKAKAADIQLLERWQQFEWKGIVGPILVDHRRNVGLHEGAHLLHKRPFLGGQGVRDRVEVAVRRRQWLSLFGVLSRRCGCCRHLGSPCCWFGLNPLDGSGRGRLCEY